MSIQSEITRISGNVSDAFTAITNKGVTVPAGSTSDDLADLISQISGGGGGAISIVDTPDAAGGTVRTITAVDISDTTAVAGDVAQGKYFYTADGTKTAGTASGGGGGGSVSPKQVNFIDYDGTVLYSYTAQEANAMSALPANPSHSGLTAQGWNWTLAQIKAQLTAVPDGPVWVGQMYVTQSGDTELDVRMPEGRLFPILTIAVNGTVTVDWGDNTATDTVTGSSLTTRQAVPHTYAAPGDYTMKIHVVSGSFTFYCDTSYTILRKNTTGNENRVYENCVQAVRLGNGITSIGNNTFQNCYSLASITIPSGVTSIGTSAFSGCYSLASITIPSDITSIENNAFYNCYSLASITIPSSVTSIGAYVFYYCYSLVSITVPSGVTSIGGSAFYYCYSLASITLPSGVTSIGTYAFYYCYSLASITIPSGVTSIGAYVFYGCSSLASITIPSGVTSIGNNAFQNCYSLASITLPSSVTSIGNNVFTYCYGVAEYHIKPTALPTLGTTAFNGIVSDCVIYVPNASLDSYKTASNWSTYASYMQGE